MLFGVVLLNLSVLAVFFGLILGGRVKYASSKKRREAGTESRAWSVLGGILKYNSLRNEGGLKILPDEASEEISDLSGNSDLDLGVVMIFAFLGEVGLFAGPLLAPTFLLRSI